MRILILSTSERTGGAAIAARRLMEALGRSGVDARMLVRDRQTDDPRVTGVRAGLWRKAWERLCILLCNRLSRRGLWKVSLANTGVDITRRPEFREADVVMIHWVCQGFLSLSDVRRILRSGKPVVWTMHDQWPFTGVCHLLLGCEGFAGGCLECPQLRGSMARRIFRRKQRVYAEGRLTFVGCSQWIADLARRSPLTVGHRVVNIPNPIPGDIFRPMPQTEARQALGLPQGRKLILSAACKVSDTLKGFRYLQEAIALVERRAADDIQSPLHDAVLLVIGQHSDLQTSLPTISIPYVSDERLMAQYYAAADVFVTGSVQENLPNTIAEAMSCGTPCVGFHVGGIPEMIDHKENGYVARYRDAQDLAEGIEYCLGHDLREAAARKAAAAYGERQVARQYIALYED